MDTVAERHEYFQSLPRERYVDAEWYDREVERILMHQWLYVGHVSQVPERGDYIARKVGPESLIIVRGDGGQVHALFNVCRHRGFPFCELGEGRVKRFTCPYHQWTYGLDGALRGAPTMPDGKYFDYADWGLHRAHCEVWHGMIFVNLNREEPEPLHGHLQEWDAEMARLEPERMKLAAQIDYHVNANWKAVIENFQECYHCAANHPDLCNVLDLDATFGLLEEHVPSEYTVGGLPLKQGTHSLTKDGGWACQKLLGEFGRGVEPPAQFTAGFMIHPMVSYALFYADHGHTQFIRPINKDETHWTCQWFVREDAVEGVDYQIDVLTGVLDQVTREDVALIEKTQHGIRSSRYVPGPNSAEREPGIRAALRTYKQLMGEV